MATSKFISNASEQTIKYGERLSKCLKKGDIVCFFGDLGTGKTTLIKGIAKGMKINQAIVHSPTFVLMNAYYGRLPIYHFDLYRLNGRDHIATIGCDEFLYGDGVAVIEWANRFGDLMPEECLNVEMAHESENQRIIKLAAKGSRYRKIVERMKMPA